MLKLYCVQFLTTSESIVRYVYANSYTDARSYAYETLPAEFAMKSQPHLTSDDDKLYIEYSNPFETVIVDEVEPFNGFVLDGGVIPVYDDENVEYAT